MILNNDEMYAVNGGVSTAFYTQLGVIGGLITFAIGMLDGFLHPKKC